MKCFHDSSWSADVVRALGSVPYSSPPLKGAIVSGHGKALPTPVAIAGSSNYYYSMSQRYLMA
jgi:hypothetical protein